MLLGSKGSETSSHPLYVESSAKWLLVGDGSWSGWHGSKRPSGDETQSCVMACPRSAVHESRRTVMLVLKSSGEPGTLMYAIARAARGTSPDAFVSERPGTTTCRSRSIAYSITYGEKPAEDMKVTRTDETQGTMPRRAQSAESGTTIM